MSESVLSFGSRVGPYYCCAGILDHDLLFDRRVFALASEQPRGHSDIFEFGRTNLRLYFLHIKRSMQKLEILQHRPDARKSFDIQSDTTDKVGGLMSGVASKAIAPMN